MESQIHGSFGEFAQTMYIRSCIHKITDGARARFMKIYTQENYQYTVHDFMTVVGYSKIKAECPKGAYEPGEFGNEEITIHRIENNAESISDVPHVH